MERRATWLEAGVQRLLARPAVVLAVMAAVVLGVGHRALLIRQDNSPEVFFSADADARRVYREAIAAFGGDEVVLVQLRGVALDAEGLQETARLDAALRRLPGVVRVLSLAAALDDPRRVVAGEKPTAAEVRLVRREARAVALYRDLGVFRPEHAALGAAALVVMPDGAARLRLARALDELQGTLEARGLDPLVAGLAPANAAIDRHARRALALFLPAVVLLALAIGLLLFRSLRALLALFLPVGGTVLLGVAGLQLAGQTLNLVTGVMPPLVLAVGFAGGIHLLAHYAARCEEGLAPPQALARTVRDKLVPTAFAFGTTALGFGSLALAEVPAVRALGIAAAGALLAALVLVTIGTPCVIALLEPRLSAPRHRHRLLELLARFALRRRWSVLVGAAVVGAVVVGGVCDLRRSVDGLEMLPAGAPERVAYQRLEREGLGLGTIDVWLHHPAADLAALLRVAPRLERLAGDLRRMPLVTGVVGAHELLRVVGMRMSGHPQLPSAAALEIALERTKRRSLRRSLRLFWNPQRGLKLTLLTLTGDEQTLRRQRQQIAAAAARHFPGAAVAVTGHFAMLLGTPGALIATLSESLALTAAVVALLFLLLLRSPWLVLGGMVANLLPVALVVGLMGWIGIPLDVATVMTASVAFGIAVDDTFHYLYHRRKSGSIVCAAHIAGQGIVATSMVVAGGFAVLALADFNPVTRFGLMTSTAVLAALAIDALLLPALVGRAAEGLETECGR